MPCYVKDAARNNCLKQQTSPNSSEEDKIDKQIKDYFVGLQDWEDVPYIHHNNTSQFLKLTHS